MCKEFISWIVGIRNREEEKHPRESSMDLTEKY
jgi:hypothetical protein